MASELWADPYLWTTTASLLAGLSIGQGLGALVRRRRSRRLARCIAYLSLAILALAGLLVLSDKAALALAPSRLLFPWSAAIACLGLLAGRFPLAAGTPVALLALAALFLLRLSLAGWLPLRPGAPLPVATLLPYEVGPASFRGQLELLERDSIPIAQELSLGSSSVALSAELLELEGPLGFCAGLVSPRTSASGTRRFYRVVGLAAPGGMGRSFPSPAYLRFLDLALPLGPSEGLEPSGPSVSRSALFGLAKRSRGTSQAASLVALERLTFNLSEDGRIDTGRD
jgi:hypothetical protein